MTIEIEILTPIDIDQLSAAMDRRAAAPTSGLAAWMPQEGQANHFGIDRDATSLRELLYRSPSTWRQRLAWRWLRLRCWVARHVLRVAVEE